jgi:hypothetical protein
VSHLSSAPEPFDGLVGVALRSHSGVVSVSKRVPNRWVFRVRGRLAEALEAGLQDQHMCADTLQVAELFVGFLDVLQLATCFAVRLNWRLFHLASPAVGSENQVAGRPD